MQRQGRVSLRLKQLSQAARSSYWQMLAAKCRCMPTAYPARASQPTLASHARASPLRRCSSRRSAAGLPSAR